MRAARIAGLVVLVFASRAHADASVTAPRLAAATVETRSLRWPKRLPCDRFPILRLASSSEATFEWTGRSGPQAAHLVRRPPPRPDFEVPREIVVDVPRPDFPIGLSNIRVSAAAGAWVRVLLVCNDVLSPARIAWQFPGNLVAADLPAAMLPPPLPARPSEREVRARLQSLLTLVCNTTGCGARPRIALEALRSPYPVHIRMACDTEPCKATVWTSTANFDWEQISCDDPVWGCESGDDLRFIDGQIRIVRRLTPVQVELMGNAIEFR